LPSLTLRATSGRYVACKRDRDKKSKKHKKHKKRKKHKKSRDEIGADKVSCPSYL